ncbi:MAG: hypothetical protein HXY35_13815 [Chloroflexi bacterium]|nr:hypothetical protein [Chloroflexota bacterium]
MKTSTIIWNTIKSNWDTILIMVIVGMIALLGFLQKVDQQVISTAILSILFLLAFNLLISRETYKRLQKTTEGILSKLERPSADDVIFEYKDWIDEIDTALETAKEVWLLSRTCATFWEDHIQQMKNILDRKGSIRLMLVDPSDGALRMIANSARFMRARDLGNGQFSKVTLYDTPNRLEKLRERVNEFIEYISDYRLQIAKGKLNLRVIDFLPPQTLVIVNGNSKNGVMFVELGAFQSSKRNRPTFFLQKDKNSTLFSFYMNEFEAMWEDAKPGEVVVTRS